MTYNLMSWRVCCLAMQPARMKCLSQALVVHQGSSGSCLALHLPPFLQLDAHAPRLAWTFWCTFLTLELFSVWSPLLEGDTPGDRGPGSFLGLDP